MMWAPLCQWYAHSSSAFLKCVFPLPNRWKSAISQLIYCNISNTDSKFPLNLNGNGTILQKRSISIFTLRFESSLPCISVPFPPSFHSHSLSTVPPSVHSAPTPPQVDPLAWITSVHFYFHCINSQMVDLLTCLPFLFLFCFVYSVMFVDRQRQICIFRVLENLWELQLKAFGWLVSYVVSRVTVLLTALYFKARFVWKCLHSTCTAVGLAVVASIRPFVCLSVHHVSALICRSAHSVSLVSACMLFSVHRCRHQTIGASLCLFILKPIHQK